MRIDCSPCCPPPLPLRCDAPIAVARLERDQAVDAHHVTTSDTARIAPATCDAKPTGKWPWQQPPTVDEVPPPQPKTIFVNYPSAAEARTGNMLDLLA